MTEERINCMSFAILQCQLSIIRYGPGKEPNPTLYKLIDIFIENGGTLERAEKIHQKMRYKNANKTKEAYQDDAES